MRNEDVTVVIPAFNEEGGIGPTLAKLIDACPGIRIIVVDDGSKDSTFSIASGFADVTVVRHQLNRGYGAALKSGMRRVETPYLAWYDSDGQHRPEDLVRILEPVMSGKADASIGARDRKSAFVARRVPGKLFLRWISQFIARRSIPDLNCGLRAFRSEVLLPYLPLLPSGFSASSTTTLLMMKRGYHVTFVNILAESRVGFSTVRMSDGFKTLGILLRILVLFDAFWLFFILAMIQIVPAVIYSVIRALNQGAGVPTLGATVFTSGLLTLGLGVLSQQINEMRQERIESNAYRPIHRV